MSSWRNRSVTTDSPPGLSVEAEKGYQIYASIYGAVT